MLLMLLMLLIAFKLAVALTVTDFQTPLKDV